MPGKQSEPLDTQTYRMPRLTLVRILMAVGLVCFPLGSVLYLISILTQHDLLMLFGLWLTCVGMLAVMIGFGAELIAGAFLKPEDDKAD